MWGLYGWFVTRKKIVENSKKKLVTHFSNKPHFNKFNQEVLKTYD